MARILLPLDGTSLNFDVVDAALGVLGSGHAVTLLAVRTEGFDQADPEAVTAFVDDKEDQILPTDWACQEVLEEGARRCEAHGVHPATTIRHGDVTAEILAACAGHDVLVMPRLTEERFRDRVRTSRTEKLARKAPCSVLLIDAPQD